MENINLIEEWQNILDRQIKLFPLIFDKNVTSDRKYMQFYNFLRKTKVNCIKYKVHISKELIIPNKYKKAVKNIINTMEKGSNWISYLSRNVYNLKYKKMDVIFNNWGILHFHLGEKKSKKDGRFVERTGELLFVFLQDDNAYLLKIYHHKQEPWYEKELLQIIYNNWPETIEYYQFKGVNDIIYKEDIDVDEKSFIKEFAKGGINILYKLKDKDGCNVHFASPKLGLTASGNSIVDVRNYHYHYNKIARLEILCENEYKLNVFKDKLISANIILWPDEEGLYLVRRYFNRKLPLIERIF